MQMTKRELEARSKAIARKVSNIKLDYSGVLPEDIPDDITDELADLVAELGNIRLQLNKE